MSVRVHVVGAFGATETDFRAALDSIGDEGNGSQRFRVGSSGKWMWANASVWHVGGSAIDDALSSLPVPALRVTSSDAVLWMITLTGPGRDRFHGVHHFTQVGDEPQELEESENGEDDGDDEFPLDELEEVAGINRFIPELQFLWDSEEEARLMKEYAEEQESFVEGLDDYADYGVTLPAAVIEEMKRNPARASYTAFMSHGRQIVEMLAEFGFEFPHTEMLNLLTVGPLTNIESDADVGNMPRFLQTLGIEGVFLDAREAEPEPTGDNETEEDASEALDWSNFPTGELFKKVTPLRTECELSPIRGGSVPLTHVALLHVLSHLFAEDPTTSVTVEFPNTMSPQVEAWQGFDALEVQQIGTQWQFCFETPHWWYHVDGREELDLNDITRALGTVPAGTRIELTFVAEGLAEKCHRYAGTIGPDGLELDQAYPPVTADVLRDALALVAEIFSSKSIEFDSREEDAVRRDYLRSQGDPPKIRNGKVMPQPGSRGEVIRTLLLERFADRGPWDAAGARAKIEEGWRIYDQVINGTYEEDGDKLDSDGEADDATETTAATSTLCEMLQAMSAATEEFNQAKTVPHSDDVLYEGRTGKFLRVSMSDLKHIPRERLDEHDAIMETLGFRSVVDSVGDVDQRQEMSRCYGGHSQAISLYGHRNESNQFGWAPNRHGATLVDFSQGTMEFHTDFEDGTSLVTTSVDTLESKPEAGIYIRSYEDVPITTLWEKHLDGIARFNEHRHTIPVDHLKFSDPAKMMARADQLFARFLGLT